MSRPNENPEIVFVTEEQQNLTTEECEKSDAEIAKINRLAKAKRVRFEDLSDSD